jgi:hypothetical protein
MTANNEANRWFHVDQERKRERRKRAERAQRRASRAARREQNLQRAFITTSDIEMQITEWLIDEFGNLSRKVYAK